MAAVNAAVASGADLGDLRRRNVPGEETAPLIPKVEADDSKKKTAKKVGKP